MKLKAYYFMSDCGDGSANCHLFGTEAEAEAAEAQELEDCGHIFNEAVGSMIIDTCDYKEIPNE